MKIKSFLYNFLFVVFMLSLASCKNDDQTRLQADWTSKDPIAIPFNARNNEQRLGNLVVNPSFETGKIYYEESNVKSYDINGWKKVGQNIQWVNSNNSEWSSEDVHHGNHAIKIERKHADETEITGDGIISDFIKVIPGNYSLKLHLKLKNICPNQSRVGTKMYDAVNIRLQYFDKNRLPISEQEHNAFSNKKIDISFKALTLANFWNIDEMGWGEIHGKTAYHPFYDGDIPDDARYVKIFIGLKGTGQMWVDDIDFRYTEQNFTILERLKPYFDSSYLAYDKVYPTPQILEKLNEIHYFNSKQSPLIVVPTNATKEVENVAVSLKELMTQQIRANNDSVNVDIQIVTAFDTSNLSDDQFVISIGKNTLYDQVKYLLPDSVLLIHNDAYYIQTELKNIIFINASSSTAFDYALNTIVQLFKNEIYYSANIIDYPDFLERAYLLHSFDGSLNLFNQKIALLNRYKLNSMYFEWYPDYTSYYPFSSVNQVNAKDESIFINLNKLATENEENKNLLLNKNKEVFNGSLKSILLADIEHLDENDCGSDIQNLQLNKSFNNIPQQQHFEFLKSLKKNITRQDLKTNLEFLSAWNRLEIMDMGHGKGELYYYDLQKEFTSNLSLYWTGGTYYSNSIDYAEFLRMSDFMSEAPLFFDNSLFVNDIRLNTDYEKNYYAGKIRVKSLIEPYHLNAFSDFNLQTGQQKIVLNTDNLDELSTIRILTAANYFWNSSSYQPDKSLWIVLNKLLGRNNAIHLIYFNDAYFGLKEICQKMKLNGQQFKNTRIARNFENQLIKYYELLNKNLQNRKLAEELAVFKTDILLKYNELTANVN